MVTLSSMPDRMSIQAMLVKRVGGGGVGGDDADADADADGDGAALGEKRKAAEEGDEAEKRAKTA